MPPPPPVATPPVPTGIVIPQAPMPVIEPKVAEPEKPHIDLGKYFPLLDTLRLYAGWLFAWYAVVMALGYYAHVRYLGYSIPFVAGLFESPLVFGFLLATFLFLLMTSILRALKGGVVLGSAFAAIGIGIFFLVKLQF